MASTNRQSIDERMVKFKGHNSLKQYIKNKPVKWGFKFWVRADSITGYVFAIKLYSGKGSGYVQGSLSNISFGASVILCMSRGLIDSGCELYFDNYFNSPELMITLHSYGIKAVGTVRKNRKGLPENIKADNLLSKEDIDFHQTKDGKLNFMKWKDTKAVLMLSNFINPKTTEQSSRKKKGSAERVTVPVPSMVLKYNSYMSGVDTADQMNAAYRYDHRSRKKYYLRMFHDLIDSCIVNGYHVHKKLYEIDGAKYQMTH